MARGPATLLDGKPDRRRYSGAADLADVQNITVHSHSPGNNLRDGSVDHVCCSPGEGDRNKITKMGNNLVGPTVIVDGPGLADLLTYLPPVGLRKDMVVAQNIIGRTFLYEGS
jgi:hypothetical protein